MQGKVLALNSYPIKGLSPKQHRRVGLTANDGFPGDRMFGFAKKNSGFGPNHPRVLPKDRFVVLFQYALLAGLDTAFDPSDQRLTISSHQSGPMHFDMTSPEGQSAACAFLSELLNLADDETPFFAHAHPHRFTDVSVVSRIFMNAVSLINLDSVRAFGRDINTDVDPRRFRGNILIEGWPPHRELKLEGAVIRIANTRFRGLKRTQRCAATEVNPDTAERDIALPYELKKAYGHRDMGLYLEVLDDGEIALGDTAVING